MAKINHNNPFEMINKIIENAKNKQAIHLYAEGDSLKGDSLIIKGKKVWHFSTTGYLGLEQDQRIKAAAAAAVFRYGTQFPLSKTYISHPLYAALEEKVEAVFQHPVIIAKNSTLAHIAVIPQAVSDQDAVILDHQVHWSVQNACQNLKTRGVPVTMIRHNNMEQLEDQLKKMGNKYRKIWYMADGIYSMYGDYCPVDDLKALSQKYPLLHLYFDDVHGMSWVGERGSGFIMKNWKTLTSKMIVISTLSKTFGASGAVILCGDSQLYQQTKNFGGPLTFSAQLEPASVAAALASADIHLSDEIYEHQLKLHHKIKLFNRLLTERNLPLISSGGTPVFYIGTGLPETSYNMVNRLRQDGFFVNPGIYPAVPLRNSGLRITISNHNDDVQINELAAALEHHLPMALSETVNSLEKINKFFGRNASAIRVQKIGNAKFKISSFNSIKNIDEKLWNRLIGCFNALDYNGLCFVENYFSNLLPDDVNYMRFKYFFITDVKNDPVDLVPLSLARWKEDMLSSEKVSEKIEIIRLEDPLYLTDLILSTGSTFTEGTYLFIDEKHADYNELTNLISELVENEFQNYKAGKIVLRDFDLQNRLGTFIIDKGYLPVEMPETAIFSNFEWEGLNDFEKILSNRSQKHFKQDVLPFFEEYTVEVKNTLDEKQLELAYGYFLNVKNNNKAINNFTYNLSLFQAMNNSEDWEFLLLNNKSSGATVGVLFCFINKCNFSLNPILIGMADLGGNRLKVYRQLLFHCILQAQKRDFKKVFFGLSAMFEKRKLGAETFRRQAFVHFSDNYLTDSLQNYE